MTRLRGNARLFRTLQLVTRTFRRASPQLDAYRDHHTNERETGLLLLAASFEWLRKGNEMGLKLQGSHPHSLEIARPAAAVRANADDARVWRWYADLMEDGRVSCTRTRKGWLITVDGRCTVEDESFDCAVRRAEQTWSDIAQSQVKLLRRSKTAVKTTASNLPRLR
ncbi:hypothetical protein HDG32_000224 [Paraburkholderia sp. CI2]|uniref:hypothetical protein n=1 Tax=Paraburkholderia sp. CI2 TaxID=2723093 RepID=UPI001822CAC0|nr:hypothetical protein [Paraburkholderia sp. CI2]MBB5464131.1 hypothetical protein [Paraburkholderia sp. CI2]